MSKKLAVVEEKKEFGPVTACKPCGSQVLVELLTVQEMMGTELIMTNKKPVGEYQALVLAIGPAVKKDDWGFSVGDRVLLSGNGVPVPDFNNSGKDKVLMDPFSIRGVLS
jgi:co-chaperonin GroES (HSP10)